MNHPTVYGQFAFTGVEDVLVPIDVDAIGEGKHESVFVRGCKERHMVDHSTHPAYVFHDDDRAVLSSGNSHHQAVGEFLIQIAYLVRDFHNWLFSIEKD